MGLFKNITIFGAGSGFTQTLPDISQTGKIFRVVDNDPGKWGKTVAGYKIFPPEVLQAKDSDEVIIICSHWKKSIARQLAAYGLQSGKDFFLDVNFLIKPEHYLRIFREFSSFLRRHDKLLAGKKVLHIGVGHTLLVDILLAMAGARVICSNLDDELIFFPDLSLKKRIYEHIATFYANDSAPFIMKPEAVIKRTTNGLSIDPSMVSFQVMDVENLAVASASVDYIFSHDLLEHVEQPQKAIEECCRVLRPGGMFYHHIHPGDHRPEKTSFDMYTHPAQQWREICQKNGYHHNRWLSCQFIEAFANAAGTIIEAESRTAPGISDVPLSLPHEIDQEFSRFTTHDFLSSTGHLTIGGVV